MAASAAQKKDAPKSLVDFLRAKKGHPPLAERPGPVSGKQTKEPKKK